MELNDNTRTEDRAKNYCRLKAFKNALSENKSKLPKNGRKKNNRNELNLKRAKILHLNVNSIWGGVV